MHCVVGFLSVSLFQLTVTGEVHRLVLGQFDSGVIGSRFLIDRDVKLGQQNRNVVVNRIWLKTCDFSIFTVYAELINQ